MSRGDLREHHELAVAMEKLHRSVEAKQELERFARHGTRHDVAADNDPIDVRPSRVVEYGFQRRQVSMNVVQCRDSHSAPRSPVCA
jgi:hypothetical protein